MKPVPAPLPRGQRRALVRLAALLALVVLAEMVLGLFANWSLERLHAQYHQRSGLMLQSINEAREAQVELKIQVQSWKNLLLRGEDPADRKPLIDDLNLHEGRVQEHLSALIKSLSEQRTVLGEDQIDRELIDRAKVLSTEHERLGESYRSALQRQAAVAWNPFELDTLVRGMDRPLDQAIDQLTDALLKRSDTVLSEARAEARQRFRLLEQLLWWAAGAALLLIGILIYRALHQQDPPA